MSQSSPHTGLENKIWTTTAALSHEPHRLYACPKGLKSEVRAPALGCPEVLVPLPKASGAHSGVCAWGLRLLHALQKHPTRVAYLPTLSNAPRRSTSFIVGCPCRKVSRRARESRRFSTNLSDACWPDWFHLRPSPQTAGGGKTLTTHQLAFFGFLAFEGLDMRLANGMSLC